MQIVDFLWRERETFSLVILFQVLDVSDRLRLYVDGEDVLVEAVVHTLQHGVVRSVGRSHGEVLLYTRNAIEAHVLCDLNGIRTPRSNHLASRSDKESAERLFVQQFGIVIQPRQFSHLCIAWQMIYLCCDDRLGWCLEEYNHSSVA